VLTVDNLVVHYGRTAALQGVSLTVATGEIVSVVGPNGAGKTTLLNAVAGAIPSTSGQIEFEGKKLNGLAPESIVRLGLSLIPEGRHIFGQLTVGENLRLGSSVRRDRAAVERHQEEILVMFPILRRLYRSSAGKLSGGEQQQLAIARALLANPTLLLLDEPSLGLAPKLVDLVFQIIQELRGKGVTILLVEQFVQRARQVSNRTYVLRQGKVVLTVEGIESGADEAHQLEMAYFGHSGTQAST
jgi:branched-chain amino acid transport system ATP-binding protein